MTRMISSPTATACGISTGAPISSAIRSLLELKGSERLLQRGVGDIGFARGLRADEGEVVVEVDRAWPEVAGLHGGHFGRTLPARARHRVAHADRDRTAFQARLVGEAHRVHALALLEFLDQRLEGLERKPKPGLDRGAAQLVGKGQRPQKEARDQVPADVQILELLGGLDRACLHRRANIPIAAMTHAPDTEGTPLVKSKPPVPEYAALDLETTGLDPARDRVIEVGAVAFTTEGVTASIERLVDPGRSVPEPVLRLTGIKAEELRGAGTEETALAELAEFLRGRQPVGHGARLDVDFLTAAGHWDETAEILDTLDLARILMPAAPSHSLPILAADLGFSQPRPHRALDDADATRQLLMRLRDEAASLDENLKESMLALVAPYAWPVARFFADALTAANPDSTPASAVRLQTHHEAKPGLPPDDPDLVAALLGPEGPLAGVLPGYEHREPQLQMLLAVAQIQARGGSLLVEAGTGTGKSLAYLVPSIARAVRHGERVVVSTDTHTLQEQLMGKDLPGLREWLPWDFKACLLKGRSNYVSLRRWRRHLSEPCQDSDDLRFKLKVLLWLHSTESGDRSELRLHGREEVFWARIASDPMDCVGIHCTKEDCYVHRARAEAEAADLVVVNHALLLADAEIGGGLLPEFDHLVIDEAHHLEDAATRGLRQEVDGPGLVALLERLAMPEPSARQGGAPGAGSARPGAGTQIAGLLGELQRQPHLGDSIEALS